MLGTRTKQVFSYGKRNQRIVNVSDDRDIERFTPYRDSGSENTTPDADASIWVHNTKKADTTSRTEESKLPSPKKVRVQKKKLRSVSISPPARKLAAPRKPKRVREIEEAEKRPTTNSKSRPKPIVISDSDGTPRRPPLGVFPLNTPGSPAVSVQMRGKSNQRMTNAKGTPLRGLQKPYSPFVEMDIIVLDGEGRKVSTERRVSRTDDGRGDSSRGKVQQKPEVIDLCESGDEDEILRPRKRPAGRARRVVISDDELDLEDLPPAAPPAEATKMIKPALKPSNSRLQVEILIESPALINRKHVAHQVQQARPNLPANVPPNPHPHSNPPPFSIQLPRFQHTASPIPRARPLTPIRSRSKRLFAHSSATPPTPSDADLSISLSDLELSFEQLELEHPAVSPPPAIRASPHLLPLLQECGQEHPHEFSAFINSFPFDPLVRSGHGMGKDIPRLQFRKIGEASYSEVFGIGDVVLKVIPIRDESLSQNGNRSQTRAATYEKQRNMREPEVDEPPPSDAKDVLKEIIVTQAMGEVCDRFVKLLRAYVVRGRYPEVLLELWDEYFNRKGSESIRPDMFGVSQTYIIIVLPNGGPDLEAYTFGRAAQTGWRQACSIFWQVAKGLAQAEQLVSFEHRDLHWGQILVKDVLNKPDTPLKPKKMGPPAPRAMMEDMIHGVRATIIDLGLARMDAGDGAGGERVHWTPLDNEIFLGEGDYQFDVYRMMRQHNDAKWEDFRPLTNVIWLHYLAQKLLHGKRLKPPAVPRKGKSQATSIKSIGSTFTERECYESLVEVEKMLGKWIAIPPVPKGKGRRKTVAPIGAAPVELTCAGTVIGYGVKRGWVKALETLL